MTLIYLTLAWIAGLVAAQAVTQIAPPPWPLAAALIGASAAVLAVGRRRAAPRRGALLALAFALGAVRYLAALPVIDAAHLVTYLGEDVSLRARVAADPDVRGDHTQLELAVEAVERGGRWLPVHGRALANVSRYPAHGYGDQLLVSGQLEAPPRLEGFDYRGYLAGRGIHAVLRSARATPVSPGGRPPALRLLYDARHALQGLIARLMPAPESGLLAGILVGQSHALPDDLADAFRVTGLTHLVVVSGYNFALVTQLAQQMLWRVAHRRVVLWGGLGAVVAYAALVGLSPPVARAAIMGALIIGAALLGRSSHPLTALAAATLVMTVVNPLVLWSVSFQLSFAATLGLLVALPAVRRAFAHRGADGAGGAPRTDSPAEPVRQMLFAVLASTVAAQLATLPVLWYHFAEVSVVSLPANALVLPLQDAVMPLGMAAAAIGAVWLPAGRLAAWPLWLILRYTTAVVEGFSGWPSAAVKVPPAGAVGLLVIYALAAGALVLHRVLGGWARVRQAVAQAWRGGRALLALGAAVALLWAAAVQLPDGRFHVQFLDVGQGDAILLRTPGGRTVLVDGGPDPTLLASRVGRALPFWQRRIDLVVASHADQDHLAGLLGIVERYEIGQVLQGTMNGDEPLQSAWRQALEERGIPVVVATRGATIALGDAARLEVLHPEGGPAAASSGDNASSIVLRVVAGECRLLLTGDIDATTEAALLATGLPLDATMLKVSHHGSGDATTDAFLDAVGPQVAVVSVGAENRFGHPAPATLARLEARGVRVLRTDRDGAVELVTDGSGYRLRTAVTWLTQGSTGG